MAALAVPFSASLHRAKSSGKYGPSEPTTANTDSDHGSSGTRNVACPTKVVDEKPGRREHKRQSLPTLEKILSRKAGRRSSSPTPKVATKKPAPKRLTKNYDHMVHDYNIMKMYAKQEDGEYLATSLCVLCEAVVPQLVFFPCQHRCVCDQCVVLNNITHEPTTSMAWTACPICMADIKLMLPHTGDEEELYWKWALEFPPALPTNFKDEFRDAAKRLGRRTSSVAPDTSVCDDPVVDTTAAKVPSAGEGPVQSAWPKRTRRSITGSQCTPRRMSLISRRSSIAGSGRLVQSEKCTIL